MKLIKHLSIVAIMTTSTLMAQTTMCFKENHSSMATIESTKLDGGECKSTFSLNDMKAKGWKVDDIKITTLPSGAYNFVYILKDGQSVAPAPMASSNISDEELEARVVKRMEEKKAQQEKEEKIKKTIELKTHGKALYVDKCQRCHGQKGELKAYYKAKAPKDMSLEEMQYAINQYTNDSDYGYGQQFLMRPFAANVNSENLEAIYEYLKSVNK